MDDNNGGSISEPRTFGNNEDGLGFGGCCFEYG